MSLRTPASGLVYDTRYLLGCSSTSRSAHCSLALMTDVPLTCLTSFRLPSMISFIKSPREVYMNRIMQISSIEIMLKSTIQIIFDGIFMYIDAFGDSVSCISLPPGTLLFENLSRNPFMSMFPGMMMKP